MRTDIAVSIGILAAILGTVYQRSYATPKPKAFGFDLGTTYSCVAYWDNGTTIVVANEHGDKVTPSVVTYKWTDSGGAIVDAVGKEAAAAAGHQLFDAKRFIGLTYDDISDTDLSVYPFRVVNSSGLPGMVPSGWPDSRAIAPERVGADILRKLLGQVESEVGMSIKRAVLAVPIEFEDKQIAATKAAAEAAGLDVMRIVYEPTAAALAYGLDAETDDRRVIVVYDIGGGTLDVSVLECWQGIFEVIATAGNNYLGGEDFTHRLMSLIAGEHYETYEASEEGLVSLRAEAERVKCELNREESSASEVATRASTAIVENVTGLPRLQRVVTLEDFENCISDLLEMALDPVVEALADAHVQASSVHRVVLVGGSSRTLAIRLRLKAMFGRERVSHSIPPEQAVAIGTSLQAGIMTDMWPVKAAAVETVFHRAKKKRVRAGRQKATA